MKNKNCTPFNYNNETLDVKTQVVKNGQIVDDWKPSVVNGKKQYRNTIIVNYIPEDGKVIPNILSVELLKAMEEEHGKLKVEPGVSYEKTYQFPNPLEQTLEDETTILTIGAKYEPIRPKFRSKLNFG